MLALLTRFVRAKGRKEFDTFTVPARGASSRPYPPVPKVAQAGLYVNCVGLPIDVQMPCLRPQFEHRLAWRPHRLGKSRELTQQRPRLARVDHLLDPEFLRRAERRAQPVQAILDLLQLGLWVGRGVDLGAI